jgi:cytochrome c biogenesis protein CcmG, thiol:disulfide interchange protein DsbE
MRVAGRRAAQQRGPVARCFFFGLLGVLLLGSVAQAADLDLSAYRGQVVYLDFWASWCGPCKQSFPWMEIMQDTYDRQGLTVIAINLEMDRADADKFLDRFRPTFEVRFDPTGKLAAFYQVHAMPSSVLIDRHGVTRFTHEGFRTIDTAAYEAQVKELLAEK